VRFLKDEGISSALLPAAVLSCLPCKIQHREGFSRATEHASKLLWGPEDCAESGVLLGPDIAPLCLQAGLIIENLVEYAGSERNDRCSQVR